MNEAPKTIYLSTDDNEEFDWVNHDNVKWCENRIDDTDIKYIRKDKYDALHAEFKTKINNEIKVLDKLMETEARIKELEEALTTIKNYAGKVDIIYQVPNLSYANDFIEHCAWLSTTARNALAKEST
jgi:hypothetical protein